ncbi:hypothetical protein VSU16_05070 [Cetobacterium somerae]|uniref:hypothetical protein n=1 Tax=Cetobacterium somerae TaxID=188913 RepID=UPI002E7C4A3E|nr:hypothetical protein [Cetobacterium somerae]WVJ02116.1 hypothetical protein VSU16_05070 [Cetobacterium somerae]
MGYVIVGHDCYCDSANNNENFAYGSIASNNRFRFKRLANNYGFFVYAYAIKLK